MLLFKELHLTKLPGFKKRDKFSEFSTRNLCNSFHSKSNRGRQLVALKLLSYLTSQCAAWLIVTDVLFKLVAPASHLNVKATTAPETSVHVYKTSRPSAASQQTRIFGSHHRRSCSPQCRSRYGPDGPGPKKFPHGETNLFLGSTQPPTEWGQSSSSPPG